jgi:hypothetical protein
VARVTPGISAAASGRDAGRRRRRLVLGLAVLAPLVAEFASGNLPIIYVWLLLIYAPLYGGAAVAIRELGRRTGKPWPVIFTLGLAYGVLEESFVSFSLFNPDYADLRLLDFGWIPALGMGSWWTIFVVLLHAVWSICIPIALVEAVAGDLSDKPWTSTRGIAWAGIAALAGGAVTTGITLSEDDFVPAPGQLAGAASAVAVLVAIGVRLARWHPTVPPSATRPDPTPAPAPTRVAAAAGGVAVLFYAGAAQVGPPLATVTLYLVLIAGTATGLRRWSSRIGWSPRHRFALAVGALAPHLAFAMIQRSLVEVPLWVDVLGDLTFAGAVLAVVLTGWRRGGGDG